MHSYFAFGLKLQSSDAIPGLIEVNERGPADVTIWVGQRPDLAEPPLPIYRDATAPGSLYENRQMFRFPERNTLCIRFNDGTDFYLDSTGTEIWTQWESPYTIEDMATYLLGPIIGYLLRIRGHVALHASSFTVENRAIALLGGAGAGKSTTVAAMALRGISVLADDVTVIREDADGFLVQPSYPHLRLWPTSVELLYGSPDRLKPITPNWDKRDLSLQDGYCFQSTSTRLAAIYVLGERLHDDTAPRVEAIDSRQQFIHLVGKTYGNGLLDAKMRSHEFEVLGRLIRVVRVKRVVPHVSSTRLPQLCDVMLNDIKTHYSTS